MNDFFGKIMGAGMNPMLSDLHKRAKKRLGQGMTPGIMKKDGTMGPGQQNAPAAPKGPSIWERITSGV